MSAAGEMRVTRDKGAVATLRQRWVHILMALGAVFWICGGHASAWAQDAVNEGERFDVQYFRPSPAPRDLTVVRKSEVIGHLTPTLGAYVDVGFDPLALLDANTGETIRAVGSRLQLTGVFGIGLYDWFDLGVAVPFVLNQTSDNLHRLGTEGPIKASDLGDIRISGRFALPFFNRNFSSPRGLGLAIAGHLSLPTGNPESFTGDGELTGGMTLIADMRVPFLVDALITANIGFWSRPERQFSGVRIDDLASFGLAAEMYVVQPLGLSAFSAMYGYPALEGLGETLRSDIANIPTEFLFGLRLQTKYSVTLTIGMAVGYPCDFGVPSLRLFSGVNFQPINSREQEQINRILESRSLDPDGDGLIKPADHCPDEPGVAENNGCPKVEVDTDGDGWVDEEDKCPEKPGGKFGKEGCPGATIEGNQIVIVDKVHFATDKDVILLESKPVLDAVAEVLREHPDLLKVRIEGHTDIRAGDEYNLDLSRRRANSIMN